MNTSPGSICGAAWLEEGPLGEWGAVPRSRLSAARLSHEINRGISQVLD
jgi:hypothetical protein